MTQEKIPQTTVLFWNIDSKISCKKYRSEKQLREFLPIFKETPNKNYISIIPH